ncbi:MAG: hypothetical protein WB368_13080 [Candidatus Sulfotelmatobacter sp.]
MSQRGNADRCIGREAISLQDVESLCTLFAKKGEGGAAEILLSAGNRRRDFTGTLMRRHSARRDFDDLRKTLEASSILMPLHQFL